MRPKRLISLLVAVCMMITMLPLSAVTAFAADTSSSPKHKINVGDYEYTYTVNGGNATITDFDGPTDGHFYDIDIPGTLGGHTVTAIGDWAFDSSDYLTGVTIPQSVTSIGDYAFLDCHTLDNVTIPPSVTSIGKSAFYRCYALTTLSLGENIEKIGSYAFAECRHLTNVTIPEKVETIEPYTFGWCLDLKYITLPAGLTSFKDRLVSCPAGFTKQSPKNGAIYYNNDKTAAERLRDNPDDQSESYHILANRNFLYLCKVTFDANGGDLTGKGGNLTNYLTDNLTDHAEVPVYKTEKITETKANDLKETDLDAINHPTRTGYTFTGWYTADGKLADGKLENGKLFNVKDTAITEDTTLYAGWAPVYHSLTVTGGTATVEKGGQSLNIVPVVTGNKKTYDVPEGAKVTVTLDKNLIPKGNVFDSWSTGNLSLPLGQDYKAETITFPMSSDANIAAQYRDASIEDDGPNVLGTAAIIGTAAVGTAVLGYQAYSLGAEFAGKLMALPYFPSNRSALAMMLWEDAGKPMPESELLYPDVGQEEQDMDLQHAARWAMENELIPDLNDEGTAPEEMKFYPDNAVSKIDVLNAWQKAQELKNN